MPCCFFCTLLLKFSVVRWVGYIYFSLCNLSTYLLYWWFVHVSEGWNKAIASALSPRLKQDDISASAAVKNVKCTFYIRFHPFLLGIKVLCIQFRRNMFLVIFSGIYIQCRLCLMHIIFCENHIKKLLAAFYKLSVMYFNYI